MSVEPARNVGTNAVIVDHLAAVGNMAIAIVIEIVPTPWCIPRRHAVRASTVIMARHRPAKSDIAIDRRLPGVSWQDVLMRCCAKCRRPGETSRISRTINLDPGNWTVFGGGGLADGGPPSAASPSSLQTITGQESGLLVPGNVSWWPCQDRDPWLQRNVIETTREFDGKLDVTPETNDTSTSEVASMH
ncbi:hypothetical protein DMN91_006523 [Ooceraea biroi]|uniref:Uncharacterized protein n=1 Tax=Ooceraea biroi TaxID=2015173 RepID=A0A3L8DPI4_OOCBI|nr:hypothetical protein DMN91_006523 [Ooceraea biroi]